LVVGSNPTSGAISELEGGNGVSVMDRSRSGRQVLRKKAGSILISSGLLPTSALETFVKRVDRSKSQFGRGVYVGDTGLELQKILPGSLLIEFRIGLVAHADKHS
jgi:hypothetical protein